MGRNAICHRHAGKVILVTGGTGFLGSVLIKHLVDAGHSITATKRQTSEIPDFLKSSSLIQWVDADITDYFSLSEAFQDIKQVYHCAAMISNQPSDANRLTHINIQGTSHIVNLCIEHRARLVHVSSIAAIGSNKYGNPSNEEDKWEFDPKASSYSIAKYKAEMEVWRGIMEGLDAVIVNPSVIMGVGAGKIASNALFDVVKKGLKIYPPGSVGIVDAEDVANIMVSLMEDTSITGERFILNSANLTNKELLDKICLLMTKPKPTIAATRTLLSIGWRMAKIASILTRKKPVLTKESARAAAKKMKFDNTKITERIGYEFKPVDKTLQQVYDTYYANN